MTIPVIIAVVKGGYAVVWPRHFEYTFSKVCDPSCAPEDMFSEATLCAIAQANHIDIPVAHCLAIHPVGLVGASSAHMVPRRAQRRSIEVMPDSEGAERELWERDAIAIANTAARATTRGLPRRKIAACIKK